MDVATMDRLQRIFVVIGAIAALLALVWLVEREAIQKPSLAVAPASPVPMTRMDVEQRLPKAEPRFAASPPMPVKASAPQLIQSPGIAPQELTYRRLATAQNFLREVAVVRDPRGGFVVQNVDAGSLYAAMGLRAGDRVFSVDTSATSELDDDTLEGAMNQQHVELLVYRSEGFVLLRYEL